jgi:hypothetical protein
MAHIQEVSRAIGAKPYKAITKWGREIEKDREAQIETIQIPIQVCEIS